MLRKIIVSNLIFICTTLFGYCFSEEELANIEYSKYGEIYNTQSIAERLNRLENDFFGMGQSGDIDSRISMLSKMTENSRRSAIIDPMSNYYPGQKKSGIRNFWDNVSSAFSEEGTITGFTPPISSSGYTTGYSSGYSNNIYRNEFTNYLNNPNRYCPYYYNNYNNSFFNRIFNRNKGIVNSRYYNNPRNYYNRMPLPPYAAYNNPHLNRMNRNYYQIPPNVTTKSSVQIIKD